MMLRFLLHPTASSSTPVRHLLSTGCRVMALMIGVLAPLLSSYACDDTVLVNGVAFTVSQQWCGKAIDSTEVAVPSSLVRLPDELCFEDYRIYVTGETRSAFMDMAAAATRDSISLIVDSGFRSAGFQARIIARRLAEGHQFEEIINHVAPPGYSQHHTARAVDLVPSEAEFAFSVAYAWLKENAAGFGFSETYPDEGSDQLWWESWHWYFQPPNSEQHLPSPE